jgi:iron complex outermembrane receptor protein
MLSLNRKSVFLAGCASLAIATPAFAEDAAATAAAAPAPTDAPGAPAAPDVNDDNVIVVTAQNRTQNVQDVPIAIQVVSGEQLAKAGFSDANDLGKIAPAVQINQDQGTVKVTVRGVGTTSNDEAQDTSVVVNVDGEYINRPNVLGVALFDIDRVEVLRGPQGTLYGRNSTGGAINFITRKPTFDFGGNASLSYGNYNAVRADAGVDLPISSNAAFRVAGFFEDRDGYVKHPAVPAFGPFPAFAGGKSDDNHAYGGRASFRYDEGGLTVDLAGEYAYRRFTPQAYAATDLNAPGNGPTGPGCNAPGYVEVAPDYAQTLCVPANTNFLAGINRGEYQAPAYGLGLIKEDTWALRGRVAYEFSPEATLTYTGGYRQFSGDPDNYLTLPIVYRSYSFQSDADTQSHELRLNGIISGVIYQVGVFYFDEKLKNNSGFFVPIGDQGSFLSYFQRNVNSKSWSGFGQVEVPLTSTLTAVGGIRYTDNKRNALYLNATPFFNPNADIFGGNPPPGGPPDAFLVPPGTPTTDYLFNSGPGRKNVLNLPYLQTLHLASKDDKITWLAGLNYQPNSDTLVYAKVTTGFKGGGFDSVGTYKPETNTAYEAGVKKNFGERSQNFINFDGYYYDYKGLQVSVLLDTTVGGQTFNAGSATIWGLEAETGFEVAHDTHLNFTANYLHTRYNELFAQFNVYTVPGTGADLNGIGDLDPNTPGIQKPNFAGNRAPFAPSWVITGNFDHVFDLGNTGTLTLAGGTTFKSSYFTDFYNYNDGKQKWFFQSDLSLEWKSANKAFSVMAFAHNIENKRPLTYGSFVSAGPDDIFNWQFGSPRLYGLRAAVDF